MENLERVVTRVGISPVKPDYGIGAYRTLMANNLLSALSKDGQIFIRIDDTNPVQHFEANIHPLFENYYRLIGSYEDIRPTPASLQGIEPLPFGLNALRQSLRNEVYLKAAEDLRRNGFIIDNGGVAYFNLDHFIFSFGDQLEQPYAGSKSGRSISIRAWRGNGGDNDTKFPIMVDDRALYHLATVVDDDELGVTHVVRGSDKIDAQVPQDMLRKALGLNPIKHAYSKMMKNTGGQSIKLNTLIDQGVSIEAVRSYLLSSLTGRPDKIYHSLSDASKDFSLQKIKPSVDQYDTARMKSIQHKIEGGALKWQK